MFAASFGLTENPFKITPNLRYVYLGENFCEVRAEAKHALSNRNGIVLLTARAGVGKSILLRLLADDIEATDAAGRILSFSCSPGATVDQLFSQALDTADTPPGSGAPTELSDGTVPSAATSRDDHLQQLVSDCIAADRPCILLIDETQNLSDHELGRLFLLIDRVDHQGGRLRMALAGPPELEDRLDRAIPSGFDRHIMLRRRLEPLPTYEVAMFIAERLEAAGCRRDGLFSEDAIALIARYAEGVPRLINTLCATALFLAEFESRDSVSADLVDEAARHVELVPPRAEESDRNSIAAGRAVVPATRYPAPAVSPLPRSERLSLPAKLEGVDRPLESNRFDLHSDWMPQPPSSSRPAGTGSDGDGLTGNRLEGDRITRDERLADRRSRSWLGLLFGASAAAAAFATLFVLVQESDRFTAFIAPFIESPPELAETGDSQPTREDTPATAADPAASGTAEEAGDAAPAGMAEAELPAPPVQNEPPPPAPAIDPDTLAAVAPEVIQGQETTPSPTDAAPQREPATRSAPPPPESAPRADESVAGNAADEEPVQAAPPAEADPPRPPEAAEPDVADRTAEATPETVPETGSSSPARPDEQTGIAEPVTAEATVDPATDSSEDASAEIASAEAGITASPAPETSQPEVEASGTQAEAESATEEAPAAETSVAEPQAPSPEVQPETQLADQTAAIEELLDRARQQIAAFALTTPEGDNAYETYQEVLALAPGHEGALQGFQDIAGKYVELAQSAERKGDPGLARRYYAKASGVAPDHPDLPAPQTERTVAMPEQPALSEIAPESAPEPAAEAEAPAVAAAPAPDSPAPDSLARDAAAPEATPQDTLGRLLAQMFSETPAEQSPQPSSRDATPAAPTDRDRLDAGAEAALAQASFPMPLSALEGTEHLRAAIAAGADVNTTFNDRRTPLIVAASQRQNEMVELLLASGADPNAATRALGTPLMYAVWNGDVVNVEALLQGGAEVNSKNIDGKTALMAAAANGHAVIVDTLLRYGAEVNSRTLNGWTPLMYAVWGRHAAVVEQLLKRGADVSAVNADGDSAARIAADRGHFEIAAMLRSQQARNQ